VPEGRDLIHGIIKKAECNRDTDKEIYAAVLNELNKMEDLKPGGETYVLRKMLRDKAPDYGVHSDIGIRDDGSIPPRREPGKRSSND
jgi:hypothetical protein